MKFSTVLFFISCTVQTLLLEQISSLNINAGACLNLLCLILSTWMGWVMIILDSKSESLLLDFKNGFKYNYIISGLLWSIIQWIYSRPEIYLIPVPLQLLFKASSIPTSLMIHFLCDRSKIQLKDYTNALITFSGLLCIIIPMKYSEQNLEYLMIFWLGIFLSCIMGYLTNLNYQNLKTRWIESLFYNNFYCLIGFIFLLNFDQKSLTLTNIPYLLIFFYLVST